MGLPDPTPMQELLDRQHKAFDSISESGKRRMISRFNKQFVDARNLIEAQTGWDRTKVSLWFKVKNPMLGNVAPAFMIAMGRGDKLISWIRTQIEEGKPPSEED